MLFYLHANSYLSLASRKNLYTYKSIKTSGLQESSDLKPGLTVRSGTMPVLRKNNIFFSKFITAKRLLSEGVKDHPCEGLGF